MCIFNTNASVASNTSVASDKYILKKDVMTIYGLSWLHVYDRDCDFVYVRVCTDVTFK